VLVAAAAEVFLVQAVPVEPAAAEPAPQIMAVIQPEQ